MNFTRIDLNTWNRREHFALYRQQIKCGFSLTTKLDITALRTALAKTGYKFYPLMIYLISRAVNQFPEFRMAMKDNELIYWEQSDPVFTVFHKETETFSALSCRYFPDLSEGTVAKLAMRQPFVLFKGLTFQKLCLPGAFRPGDHH
ncbi:CatA-like O-acetyltransferase, partial [Klebsiella pneumoniae]